jgi:hypothetical protein
MVDRFRSSHAIAVLLVALLGTASARASSATGVVGGLAPTFVESRAQVLEVDLTRPATAVGDYSSATVLWTAGSGNPCASAFKVRFYRPNEELTTMSLVGERGPFDVQPGLVTVSLSPPVALQAGDLLAIVELLTAPCGSVTLTSGAGGLKTLVIPEDEDPGATVSICANGASLDSLAMSAIATAGGTEVRAGIVTGAGSVHGASSSSFKTGMQLVNAGDTDIHGRLVFHPIKQSASPSDRSLPYAIPTQQGISLPDVVDALGATGLGSIDVIADASYAPLIVTHVFNDAGAAGTAGFTEPTVRSGDQYVLESGDVGTLVAPADLTKFRMNIGVRSLSNGASLFIGLRDSTNGHTRQLVTRNYSADFFDQLPAKDFLNGTDVGPNDLIEISVESGRAIVYGASVDNVTNDTSLQLATRTGF